MAWNVTVSQGMNLLVLCTTSGLDTCNEIALVFNSLPHMISSNPVKPTRAVSFLFVTDKSRDSELTDNSDDDDLLEPPSVLLPLSAPSDAPPKSKKTVG